MSDIAVTLQEPRSASLLPMPGLVFCASSRATRVHCAAALLQVNLPGIRRTPPWTLMGSRLPAGPCGTRPAMPSRSKPLLPARECSCKSGPFPPRGPCRSLVALVSILAHEKEAPRRRRRRRRRRRAPILSKQCRAAPRRRLPCPTRDSCAARRPRARETPPARQALTHRGAGAARAKRCACAREPRGKGLPMTYRSTARRGLQQGGPTPHRRRRGVCSVSTVLAYTLSC